MLVSVCVDPVDWWVSRTQKKMTFWWLKFDVPTTALTLTSVIKKMRIDLCWGIQTPRGQWSVTPSAKITTFIDASDNKRHSGDILPVAYIICSSYKFCHLHVLCNHQEVKFFAHHCHAAFSLVSEVIDHIKQLWSFFFFCKSVINGLSDLTYSKLSMLAWQAS